jgi:uncharacterized protein with von Willebrand factor type A (vWA) domain
MAPQAEPDPPDGPGSGPTGRADSNSSSRQRGWSYTRYVDGPDPLAPPLDLQAALDRIGDDVMSGTSVRQAIRELLRRGDGTRVGLDEFSRRLWKRRRELQRDNRIDGTLREVRRLLKEALDHERQALSSENTEDARFRELALDALPDDPAGAVRELDGYDWRSAEARAAFEELRDLLGRELLDQRFAGMKQALENAGPGDAARIQRMLDALNSLLSAHASGADTTQQFADFMNEHGEFFPEQPGNVEELVDLLAARSAAAQRLLASMSPEQRDELEQLSQQAFGSPELAASLAQLDAQLRDLRPGEDWTGSSPFRGDNPLGLGEATRAIEEIGRLESLTEQMSQAYPGASLDDIDLDAVAAALGEPARAQIRELAELERALRAEGFVERAADGSLKLSPKAIRRLGATVLQDVLRAAHGHGGERDTRRAGAAGDLTGSTRPWSYGDTQSWNVPRTLLNASLRHAAGDPALLDLADMEISETEQRTRAAVALCVDTSWSMVQEGRWVPMKRTALALNQLIHTRFRTDALELITFGRAAARVEIGELVGLDGAYMQGTNLHHALMLAGEHLREHPDATPVVLVVTDGEPTAHIDPDGTPVFAYPPQPATLRATISELDRLTARGASITFFALGDEPRLARLVDAMARRAGGRVVAPDLDGLGAEVIADYVRSRR